MRMRINIIVGPPCAGKSTHVTANAVTDSVIIDLDKIATSIGSGSPHTSTEDIRNIAFKMRWSAIFGILDGIDSDAWIIHTNPPSHLINKYVDNGALFTIIDPGKEACLDRIETDSRPDGTAEAIEKWYDSPPEIPEDSIIDSMTLAVNKLNESIYNCRQALRTSK